jgi:hypothetical protein
MTGVAAWSTFTPSVIKATSTTTNYPTPTPGLPIPPSGYVSSSVTNNSKTTNANQFVSVSTSFLSNANNNITTSLPLTQTTDQTTNGAIYKLVNIFMFNRMGCPREHLSYNDPSSVCFAILTRRNTGSDPDVDDYNIKDKDIVQHAFSYCNYTYLQLNPGISLNVKRLLFPEIDPADSTAVSAADATLHGDLIVIAGLPDTIALADVKHVLAARSPPPPAPNTAPPSGGPCSTATSGAASGSNQ